MERLYWKELIPRSVVASLLFALVCYVLSLFYLGDRPTEILKPIKLFVIAFLSMFSAHVFNFPRYCCNLQIEKKTSALEIAITALTVIIFLAFVEVCFTLISTLTEDRRFPLLLFLPLIGLCLLYRKIVFYRITNPKFDLVSRGSE